MIGLLVGMLPLKLSLHFLVLMHHILQALIVLQLHNALNVSINPTLEPCHGSLRFLYIGSPHSHYHLFMILINALATLCEAL